MMNERPGWDEYFMEMAILTAKRSTCLRRQVGAVIVQDRHIISTGYNEAPGGWNTAGSGKADASASSWEFLRVSGMNCAGRFTRNKTRLFRQLPWDIASRELRFILPTSRVSSARR